MKKSKSKAPSYLHKFEAFLRENEAAAVSAMERLIALTPPKGFDQYAFQTDFQEWEDRLISVHVTDEYSETVSTKHPYGGHPLFAAPGFPLSIDPVMKSFSLLKRCTEAMAAWLGQSWGKAGGPKTGRKAFFEHHDEGHYFNLNSMKWKKY